MVVSLAVPTAVLGLRLGVGRARLKPNTSPFDPEQNSVMVFTKRLQQLGHQYGDQTVLEVFPVCLKGECSMAECILRVERRSKKDILEARFAHPNMIIILLPLAPYRFATDETAPLGSCLILQLATKILMG
ncbi:hypothetical protein BDV11DRAFT_130084 [Aspergillus similis]